MGLLYYVFCFIGLFGLYVFVLCDRVIISSRWAEKFSSLFGLIPGKGFFSPSPGEPLVKGGYFGQRYKCDLYICALIFEMDIYCCRRVWLKIVLVVFWVESGIRGSVPLIW